MVFVVMVTITVTWLTLFKAPEQNNCNKLLLVSYGVKHPCPLSTCPIVLLMLCHLTPPSAPVIITTATRCRQTSGTTTCCTNTCFSACLLLEVRFRFLNKDVSVAKLYSTYSTRVFLHCIGRNFINNLDDSVFYTKESCVVSKVLPSLLWSGQ